MRELYFEGVTVPSPQCLDCAWFNRQELTCPAFGDASIPEEIQLNLHDHQFAYDGDGGVRFKERF